MRKIILLIIPVLLLGAESDSEDESFKIKADSFTFDKKNLFFDDGFYLEHSFGKIFANRADFSNLKKDKTFDFKLKNGVKLVTNTGGVLQSDSADFESISQKIRFYSKEMVTFIDKIKAKDLEIKSNEVVCLLDTKKCIKNLKMQDIYSITFFKDVCITIEAKFKIFSEKAILKKNDTSSFVYLIPPKNEFCIFTFDENAIIALNAKLDLNNLDLLLQNSSGTLRNALKQNTILCFSSDKLLWHNFENALILKGNVKIIDSQFGTIDSDEIEIVKKMKENNFKKIIAKKNSSLNFFSKYNSKIKTSGILEIDNEKKMITAFSLKNPDEDIVYEDSKVFISSKKAKSSFDNDNNIQDLVLEKDVHFIYKKDNRPIGYGIADKIEYFPNDNLIKLKSDGQKKVLFWQADNSTKLSAKEIVINQKEKNDIKGIGDVRFTFNLEEENLIHEIFSKYISYE